MMCSPVLMRFPQKSGAEFSTIAEKESPDCYVQNFPISFGAKEVAWKLQRKMPGMFWH